MLDRYENRLEIQGAVYRPGIYQLGGDIKTVKQLIAKADGLKGDAFTNRALLHRENDDLSRETIALDLKAIMNGSAADVELQKNDIVFIASIYDLKERGTITVVGEVVKPGAFEFAENTTIEDIIIQAGGLLESASIAKVDVSRRVKNSTSTEANSTLTELYTFSIKDGFVIDGENGFVLQPYDQVYVRRSPGYKVQHHVQVQGQVVFEGTYALSSTNERLSDIIKKAGGITDWAYVKGARLNRVITPEERVRMKSTVEMLNRGKDSIDVTKLELGNSYYVGIDLEAALKNPGSDADIVLREDDIIMVPELLNTVKISGNVMYPNVVSYSSNLSVKDFVEMAGGYGFKSKKNKAYIIYMNGQVARARQNSKKVVEPGCEIVIPQKRQNEGALQNILSIATTSASLATMIASITNLVK
jgi:protein involved in polysaccharide export with SLBB domain